MPWPDKASTFRRERIFLSMKKAQKTAKTVKRERTFARAPHRLTFDRRYACDMLTIPVPMDLAERIRDEIYKSDTPLGIFVNGAVSMELKRRRNAAIHPS